jgi:hypothetical protein
MTDPKPPPPSFNRDDFVIFTPAKVAMLEYPDMPPNAFYLVSVLEDKADNFDFEILDSGALAMCEALAISACRRGQRIWFSNTNPGDSDQ